MENETDFRLCEGRTEGFGKSGRSGVRVMLGTASEAKPGDGCGELAGVECAEWVGTRRNLGVSTRGEGGLSCAGKRRHEGRMSSDRMRKRTSREICRSILSDGLACCSVVVPAL